MIAIEFAKEPSKEVFANPNFRYVVITPTISYGIPADFSNLVAVVINEKYHEELDWIQVEGNVILNLISVVQKLMIDQYGGPCEGNRQFVYEYGKEVVVRENP